MRRESIFFQAALWLIVISGSALLAQEPSSAVPEQPPAETSQSPGSEAPGNEPPVGVATEATQAANADVAAGFAFSDEKDFENASRGLLGQIEEESIYNADGTVSWDFSRFSFLKGDAPATVNPSLWRQSRLASIHGLFEVTDGIYQIRGYDLAVMTLIRGNTGWIVIDPLTSPAPAKAGFELAQKILGERPLAGVIFTHSHVDHFGGIRGLIDEKTLAEHPIPILAPEGFTAESVSENVLAGNAMARRSTYMFGMLLPFSETGNVGSGLGEAVSNGPVGFLRPTEEIGKTGETREIDGVTFDFMMAGGTEAPAEFVFYIPQFNALCAAEVVTKNFHNLLTLRGAKVRDALQWSKVIDEMLMRFGDKADVMFASHHWPTWGKDDIRTVLLHQRDLYRYVHDQTLRLANSGETPVEIAEEIGEPDFSKTDSSVRGYYGTMNHNSKAVYQNYFGWWDGVPADLYKLPPQEESRHYVDYMGGADAVLAKAKESFAKGEYRWTATVLNHLVFADPTNGEAKKWLAASYEQLGFQSESGAWRNYFLTGAKELREGTPKLPPLQLGSREFLKAIPTPKLFDALSVRFNPAKIRRDPFVVAFDFPDTKESIVIYVDRNVAVPRVEVVENPTVRLTLNRSDFDSLLLREVLPQQMTADGKLTITGDATAAFAYLLSLDQFPFWFNVITP